MKRIIHLSSVHSTFDIRIFHKECRSLADAGYEVHLIVTGVRDTKRHGVQIHAVRPEKNRLLRMTRTVWSVYRKALALRGDVYHFHDPELLPVGLLLSILRKRVIFDVHENISAQILNKNWIPFRKPISVIYSWLERILIGKQMGIVLAENSYREHYHRLGCHYLTLLNYPHIPLLPSTPYPDRKDSMVYVGVLSADRGLEQILEAMAILRNRGLWSCFECIGRFFDPAHESKIRLKVKCLELDSRITFHGWLDHEVALGVMGESRIGLSIMLPIPNYRESYSTKIFEYMALGIPFIVSDFPIYRDILDYAGNCGILVDPLDPCSIAEAIDYLMSHPSEAEEMGRRGRLAVESRYNWGFEKAKLLALYERMLKT